MKTLWLCAALLFIVQPLRAATVSVTSPDIAHVRADSEATEHSLFWNSKEQVLYAYVRFSNHLYSDVQEPLMEESHVFRLPGIKYDPATKTFYAKPSQGERINVATQRDGFLSRHIQPSKDATLYILKHSGDATVSLEAASGEQPYFLRGQWVERDTGVSLQNFLRSLAVK